jgi:hypothetical protein
LAEIFFTERYRFKVDLGIAENYHAVADYCENTFTGDAFEVGIDIGTIGVEKSSG